MRLSKIKLSGFKSFVENTTIDLNGTLVGIVGPNGCGKSNIIDAIRWVLGESSAKQLRGGAMQDVIFNGADKRSSVSRASVELIFDNSYEPKVLTNSIYSTYSEISVKRVITRQGDSDYLINNQTVRRRDVVDMFLGTGIGSRGYAIIEQGMISRIIESRPEELRIYLEEASGVSKYRERRRETLSKLEHTKDNLVRVHDLQHELAITIEKLTHQAAKAREYQQLNNRLNELNLLNCLLKKENNQIQYQNVAAEIERYKIKLDEIYCSKNIVREELQKNYEKKELLDQEYSDLSIRFNELRATIARNEERELNNTKRLNSLNIILEQHKLDIERLNGEITINEENILDFNQQLLSLHDELDNASKGNNTVLLSEFASKQQEHLVQVKDLENQLTELRHNKNLILNTYNHKKQQLQSLMVRKNKLVQDTSVNLLDLDIQYNELAHNLEQEQNKLLILKQEYLSYESKLSDCRNKKTVIDEQINKLNNDISALKSSQIMLEQLLSSTEVEVKNSNCAKLLDIISVDDRYINAVNAVLDMYLSAKLVFSIKDLFASGIAIISTQNKVSIKPNSLASIVKLTDERFSTIFSVLNDYILFDDLSRLINTTDKYDNGKYVDLKGDILFNGIFVAHNSRTLPNLLYYQAELAKVKNDLADKQKELATLNTKCSDMNTQINYLFNLFNELRQNLDKQYGIVNSLTLEHSKLEQNHNFIKNHQQKVLLELETVNFDISFLEDELIEIATQLDELESMIKIIDKKLDDSQKQLDSINQVYNSLLEKDKEYKSSLDKMRTDILLLNQKIESLRNLNNDKQQQIIGLTYKNIDLEYEINELNYQLENSKLVDLKDEIISLTVLIDEKSNAIKAINDCIDSLKDKQVLLEQQIDDLKDKISVKNLKLQESRIAINNIDELLVELSVDENEINSILSNNKLTLNEIQLNINTCKNQLEELGLVNLAAIEDLDESSKKYDEVARQINDLEQAINTLEAAINQIDKTTSTMLYDTYNQVNTIFNDYFRLLFGGGGARLDLTDNDILTAGIQIFAQPLGKKNSSIHLLSGGEKALTAVSLVFAFFSLSPSPFCILDEVDAPLDDANTLRFCKLVKQLATNTQFIYISHNRLAMEMADQLIGVTMQEKGVSTIVSVKLDTK